MSGTPWTPKDDDVLHNLWRAGATDGVIAFMLGRTTQAIKSRRLEKRWVADRAPREAVHQSLEPLSCNDVSVFRASVSHATAELIERITAGIERGTLRSPRRAA